MRNGSWAGVALGCGGPGSERTSFAPVDAGVVDDGSSGTEDAGVTCFLLSTLEVVVLDQQMGEDVCNATVVVQGSGAALNLAVHGSEASCSYSTTQLPSDTYRIDVTAPGYLPGEKMDVNVDSSSCGSGPPIVTIAPVPISTATDASVDQAATDASNEAASDGAGPD